jgi:hypothetical protein
MGAAAEEQRGEAWEGIMNLRSLLVLSIILLLVACGKNDDRIDGTSLEHYQSSLARISATLSADERSRLSTALDVMWSDFIRRNPALIERIRDTPGGTERPPEFLAELHLLTKDEVLAAADRIAAANYAAAQRQADARAKSFRLNEVTRRISDIERKIAALSNTLMKFDAGRAIQLVRADLHLQDARSTWDEVRLQIKNNGPSTIDWVVVQLSAREDGRERSTATVIIPHQFSQAGIAPGETATFSSSEVRPCCSEDQRTAIRSGRAKLSWVVLAAGSGLSWSQFDLEQLKRPTSDEIETLKTERAQLQRELETLRADTSLSGDRS